MSRCPSASWPSRFRGETGQPCPPAGSESAAFWEKKVRSVLTHADQHQETEVIWLYRHNLNSRHHHRPAQKLSVSDQDASEQNISFLTLNHHAVSEKRLHTLGLKLFRSQLLHNLTLLLFLIHLFFIFFCTEEKVLFPQCTSHVKKSEINFSGCGCES